MPDGLLIQVGADFNQAISGFKKFGLTLDQAEKRFADLIKTSDDFDAALVQLAKEGGVSIGFLEKEIKDFKTAFSSATDPQEAKKFGDVLNILKIRQQELINSGLGVAAAEEKAGKAHAANTVGVQRLSSSFLGLSKVFQVLPPELAHLTHGFDQIFQSFERTAHGTETTGDAVKKFAGVLGQVGLGLAIGVAVGLLTTFVQELFNADAALEKATEEGIRFGEAIDRINESIKSSKENIKFIGELSDLNVDINFGKGFEADLLKVRGGFEDLRQEAFSLGENLTKATEIADEAWKSMQEGLSETGQAAIAAFSKISKVPDAAIKGLSEADKQFIQNAKNTAAEREKIQEDIFKNEQAQELQRSRIRLTKADKEREDAKKSNQGIDRDLQERLNIIKEFTAKFATIKDPFPDFFTKNLPIGKIENKGLRAALDNAFKVLETASKDLFNTNKIDPGTIPLEIHFKPEIVGKSALVREIEDKFGEIKGIVEDAVNKGIFEVPLDFKLPSEGDGDALKQAEDFVNDLAQSIEGLTGQKKAILNFNFDTNKLTPANMEAILEKVQDELTKFASNVPLKITVNADLSVSAKPDKDRILRELNQTMSDITSQFANDTAANLGNALGDALSGEGLGDAFKNFGKILSDALGSIGKALIAAGIKMALAKAAISKLFSNPAVAIAAGIALVALSRLLQNSISTAAREKGGPVQKGFAYTVNERGQEAFMTNSGKLSMIEGGIQTFRPQESGKIIPASLAKLIAQKFNIAAFAGGGLVSGSTFGLLGEGAGISASNPEVIAPLDRLKGLLGLGGSTDLNLTLAMQTRGKDYALINNRQNRFNQRNT